MYHCFLFFCPAVQQGTLDGSPLLDEFQEFSLTHSFCLNRYPSSLAGVIENALYPPTFTFFVSFIIGSHVGLEVAHDHKDAMPWCPVDLLQQTIVVMHPCPRHLLVQ